MPTTTTAPTAEQRFRLSLVSWEKYESLRAWFEGRPLRITFDRGEIEIRTLSYLHERTKKLLARLIESLSVEIDCDIHSGGSMTFKREDLERGLEPDECWWIEHEPQMRERSDYDPLTQPPPDLVMEVEVSRSVLDRLAIYVAMNVPEVWRWDGERLRFCLLKRGKYEESAQSKSFPMLAASELQRFVAMTGVSETKLLRDFRDWITQQRPHNWPSAPSKPKKSRSK
jgi:Uma2 family endonuclease